VQQFDQAQIQARVDAELARRMPEAVRQAVAASAPREDKQLPAALASLSDRLDQVEKAREADLKDVRGAFGAIERKLNVMYVSAARLGGD
jgi:tRNA(Glu) U13 pseudouridine synthase TruD